MASQDRPTRGLLDTSTLILLPQLRDASIFRSSRSSRPSPGQSCPSVPSSPADGERTALQAHLQQAEADFEPLSFDSAAARAFGQVAASLRRAGPKPAARSYDAMIAAAAVANDLPLYTCNHDFAAIVRLRVIKVPHPNAWLDALVAYLKGRPASLRPKARLCPGNQVSMSPSI
jgi:tRNA(fMet)-specific endonuclease VapC